MIITAQDVMRKFLELSVRDRRIVADELAGVPRDKSYPNREDFTKAFLDGIVSRGTMEALKKRLFPEHYFEQAAQVGPTEKQQLLAMLTRAGIGHGRHLDYQDGKVNGESVQIEADAPEEFNCAEFDFDNDGKLKTVHVYRSEDG